MSEPVKQHYVPQTYLRNFTDSSGFIHTYRHENKKFIKQTPKNTAFQKNFYTIENEGNKDYTIEKILAENVDNLYNPLINKISRNEQLTAQERYDLSLFITIQYLRTPHQRETLNDTTADLYKHIAGMTLNYGASQGDLDPKRVQDMLDNDEIDVTVPKDFSLKFMLDFSEKMTDMIYKHQFIIAEASSKSEFITSDNPYCMIKEKWSGDYEGFGIYNTKKCFPLSPKYLLVLQSPKNYKFDNKIHYIKHGKKDVRRLNMLTAYWSHDFVYSSNEFILQSIVSKTFKK